MGTMEQDMLIFCSGFIAGGLFVAALTEAGIQRLSRWFATR